MIFKKPDRGTYLLSGFFVTIKNPIDKIHFIKYNLVKDKQGAFRIGFVEWRNNNVNFSNIFQCGRYYCQGS